MIVSPMIFKVIFRLGRSAPPKLIRINVQPLILRQIRSMATPMINKEVLRSAVVLVDGAAGAGVTDRALRAAGLNREALNGEPGFLPLAAEAVFGDAVSRATGERHIGVLVGENFRYRELGWYADYVLGAPLLSGALARGRRALPLLHPACDVVVRDAGQHIVLSFDTHLHHVNGAQHVHEAMPFLLIDLARNYLGEAWMPDWVEMTMDARAGGMGANAFPTQDIRYGSDLPGIAMRKADLRARNPDPPDASNLVRLEDLPSLMGLTPPETVADEVLTILRAQFIHGPPSADIVARRLASGVRSLQRSLQAEGTSFREVQQQFLKERAMALLAETDLQVCEVARALGYREPDSFRRAFVKWTGAPPTHFARGTAARRDLVE
jgi:AraC-like DNA-binding protein